MAALPYMQLYVADYLADTVHLDTDEHGAYLLLMMNYFQTGKPIPKNRLQSITKLSNERWTVVERSLNEFFNDVGTHWQHDRIDADLRMVQESQSQRSRAGKASAEARKRAKRKIQVTENHKDSNERSTTVEQALNGGSNDRSTNEDKKQIRTDKKQIRTDDGVAQGDPEKQSPSFSENEFRPIDRLIEVHNYDPVRTRTKAGNIATAGQWLADGLTADKLDEAVEVARVSLRAKGDTNDPPLLYLDRVIASQKTAKPKKANAYGDFEKRDYAGDPAIKGRVAAGGAT